MLFQLNEFSTFWKSIFQTEEPWKTIKDNPEKAAILFL
jgi:hypothetical protein